MGSGEQAFCPFCGNPEGGDFCPECGSDLSVPPAAVA